MEKEFDDKKFSEAMEKARTTISDCESKIEAIRASMKELEKPNRLI